MLNFENATLLSYSHNSEFFGDNIRYKTTKDISIEGYILDLSNTEGVSGIWSGISGFIDGATDYNRIIINGTDFGAGKITSIDFREGNDVRVKNYTANLNVWATGNLFNIDLTSGYYSGINPAFWYCIDTLNEGFSYQNTEGQNHSYNHSIDIRLHSGSGFDPIAAAKFVAQNLFDSNNLQGFLGQYTGLNLKKYYREGYNLITNECNFEENVEFGPNSGNYSLNYTHSFDVDERGIISVRENGNIKGLVNSIYPAALSGWQEQEPLIFGRCSGVFLAYAPSGAYPIATMPIQKGLQLNSFEGLIDYNMAYTNDPKYADKYSWEYTDQIRRNTDNGLYEVSENGTIIGFGRRYIDRLPNAISGWQTISGTIYDRVNGYYTGVTANPLSLKLIGETNGRSDFDGTVQYSRNYTDDLTILSGSFIKREELNIDDIEVVALTNKFNIVNVKELIQPAGIGTLGRRNASINLVGARTGDLNDYLLFASGVLDDYIPTNKGSDVYLQDCNYSFNKNENKFNMSVSWAFHKDGSFTGILIW